jgi:hypothetical protein
VVSVPLNNYQTVSVEPFAVKTITDANNYYPERNGHIPVLGNGWTTASELLQAHLPTSKVVTTRMGILCAQMAEVCYNFFALPGWCNW